MPDTPFARWQDRTGLTRAVDAAAALGVTRRTVERLRNGEQKPHPSTRRLMEILEANPGLTESRSRLAR